MNKIKTVPAEGSRGKRAKLNMIDDEWNLDPKIADELAKKAYEAMGISPKDFKYVDKTFFATSSIPTVLESDVFACIAQMENELEMIKPDEKDSELWCGYWGYMCALNTVKEWFLGKQKFNDTTGEIDYYRYGRLVERKKLNE